MRGKILFLTGLGVGYVLGTKAGRERYEQIAKAAGRIWNDPRVVERRDQVEDFVKDKAPEVAEFVSDGAKKLVAQATGGRGKTSPSASTSASGTSAAKPAAKKPAARKPATRKAAGSGSSSTSS